MTNPSVYPVLKSTVSMKKLKAFCHIVELLRDLSIQITPFEAFIVSHCTGEYCVKDLGYILERILPPEYGDPNLFLQDTLHKMRFFVDLESTPSRKAAGRYHPADFLYLPERAENRYETPVDMTLILTHRCNFRCVYCYNSSGDMKSRDLSTDQWLSLIAEARELNVLKCTLTGGEPLMYPGFFQILSALQSYKILTYICTNGSLITEAAVKQFSRLEVPLIQISLDSPKDTVHHTLTGSSGTFDRVIQAIRNLTEAGIAVYVKALMLRETVEDAERLIDLCCEWGVLNLVLDRYDLCYNGRGDNRFFLSAAREMELEKLVERKRAEIGKRMNINVITGTRKWLSKDDVVMCGGFMNGFTVSPEGDFPVCEKTIGIPQFTVGNTKSMSLREMWYSPRIDEIFAPAQERIKEPCLGCEHFAICRTGCFAAKRFLTNDYYMPDPNCWKAPYHNNPFWAAR